MKKSDIYEIVLKILGLYLLVMKVTDALQDFTFTCIRAMHTNFSDNDLFEDHNFAFMEGVLSTALLAVYIVLVWLLLFKTKNMARMLCRVEAEEQPLALQWTRQQWYETGLLMASAIVLAIGIPDMVSDIKTYILIAPKSKSEYILVKDNRFLFATLISAAKVFLGLVTLLSAGRFGNYLSARQMEIAKGE